ncbi:hypothetical protein D3C87_1875430 [compost metagenome]
MHDIAGFFLRLGANTFLRRSVVQQTGGSLDQHAIVTVDEHRKAKLTRQHYRLRLPVEQQNGRAVTAIVGFATLPLPYAIAA